MQETFSGYEGLPRTIRNRVKPSPNDDGVVYKQSVIVTELELKASAIQTRRLADNEIQNVQNVRAFLQANS